MAGSPKILAEIGPLGVIFYSIGERCNREFDRSPEVGRTGVGFV
jgi:hypothetical protein